jgi:hypothetical protein
LIPNTLAGHYGLDLLLDVNACFMPGTEVIQVIGMKQTDTCGFQRFAFISILTLANGPQV